MWPFKRGTYIVVWQAIVISLLTEREKISRKGIYLYTNEGKSIAILYLYM
jgi:hypothetical protein